MLSSSTLRVTYFDSLILTKRKALSSCLWEFRGTGNLEWQAFFFKHIYVHSGRVTPGSIHISEVQLVESWPTEGWTQFLPGFFISPNSKGKSRGWWGLGEWGKRQPLITSSWVRLEYVALEWCSERNVEATWLVYMIAVCHWVMGQCDGAWSPWYCY